MLLPSSSCYCAALRCSIPCAASVTSGKCRRYVHRRRTSRTYDRPSPGPRPPAPQDEPRFPVEVVCSSSRLRGRLPCVRAGVGTSGPAQAGLPVACQTQAHSIGLCWVALWRFLGMLLLLYVLMLAYCTLLHRKYFPLPPQLIISWVHVPVHRHAP